MSDTSPQEQAGASESPLIARTTSVVVSRARFDSVPRKRAWYIGFYVVSFLLWGYMAVSILLLGSATREEVDPAGETAQNVEVVPEPPVEIDSVDWPTSIRIIRTLIPVTIAIFYIPFVNVLRIMGYPWVGVLAFCAFAFVPIPGLLVVAYLDTRIAKAWNAADLSSQSPSHS